MSLPHGALALLVVVIWGANFVVMKIGLGVLPPLFFSFLRFLCSAVPLVLFLKRPAVPWRLLWSYALAQFSFQYAFLLVGMKLGLSPGLSSVVIQLQPFFTMALAIPMLGEAPRRAQIAGALVAFAGMVVVALNVDSRATFIGFLMVATAALCWGFGNIFTKRIAVVARDGGVRIDPLQIVAWGSLLAAGPLLVASLVLEGPATIVASLNRVTPTIVAAVLVNAYAANVFGFGAWSLLMRHYAASTVSTFALLVPIVGLASAALFDGEAPHAWTLLAGALVVSGLAINQWATRRALPRPHASTSENSR